jgi:plasmid stability protein
MRAAAGAVRDRPGPLREQVSEGLGHPRRRANALLYVRSLVERRGRKSLQPTVLRARRRPAWPASLDGWRAGRSRKGADLSADPRPLADDSAAQARCYHCGDVRQLITRIDDDLHRRLKERAREEGRSLNALVTQILEEAVPDESPRARLRRRLRAEGRLRDFPIPENPPSLEEVREMLRGDAGKAFLEALDEDRRR